jgi:hypothetical protein
MGCHTWFYKKIEGPTEEQIRKDLVVYFQETIQFYDSALNQKESLDDLTKEVLEGVSDEELEAERDEFLFLYRRFASGEMGIDEVNENWASSRFSRHIEYSRKMGWYETDDSLPHDLFRIGSYPETLLFSLEETLDFIQTNKCTVYEYTDEKLRDFWAEFPDGMIRFG